jgi:hypothetical protein
MGLISRAAGRLPSWAKFILGALGVAAIVYGIARYGWTFLLRVIFSPDL